jgi:thiamine biosynthesis lipoprotein
MGTQIRLAFYASDKQKADSVAHLAFRRIDTLNTKLSDYLENSELNYLCKQVGKDVVVSDDLYNILMEANSISKKTQGAFDVSVGPLIRLWRKARKRNELPDKAELDSVKQSVGYQHIKFPKKNTVLLTKHGMQLDLGGIGKGYTADEVLKVLENNGIPSALIDMGGDISVSNPPPNRDYWILAFSYYNKKGKEISQKIKLKNQSVATSGDLFQSIELDGIRHSHIINPKTGMALTNSIQVTTIAENGAMADAYASALSVLGFEGAKGVTQELTNFKYFMVGYSKDGHQQWSSPSFKIFLEQ